MSKVLTQEEYKKIVIEIAIKISPEVIKIKKTNSKYTADAIALYAKDIASAVETVIENRNNN